MHALIVAGPSGAGKTSFLRELLAGRLPSDVRRHLPPGAQSWPVVRCSRREEWQPFLTDMDPASRSAGLAVHYDITFKWRKLKQRLAHDPFWQVLQRCEAVTLVVIRPPHRRLVDQWSQSHLGVRGPWKVRSRKLLAAAAPHLLAGIRRLRVSKHPKAPERTRYPRPIRFLKQVDRALRNIRVRSIETFDFYRHRERVEQMLRSWDEVVAAKTAALPLTHIELVPDPASEIGKTFGWRVTTLEPTKRPSAPARNLSLA